jgi:hypothetical protein
MQLQNYKTKDLRHYHFYTKNEVIKLIAQAKRQNKYL